MDNNEMPLLKVKLSKFEIQEMQRKRGKRWKIFLILLFVLGILGGGGYCSYSYVRNNKLFGFKNEAKITKIDVVSYDQAKDIINISLSFDKEQKACAFTTDSSNSNNLNYIELKDNKCELVVPFAAGYVFLKNADGIVTDPIELNNYVVDFNVKDKYYLASTSKGSLVDNMVVVGKPNIEIQSSTEAINLKEFSYVANSVGATNLTIKNGDLQEKTTELIVTDTIVEMPKEYNNKKPYLGCEQYTEEEANLLDEILAYRVEEAGYETRAGVVAAARFLTLELPYKIAYYFENGRLNGTGTHIVDAEGRYYHKGLYLHKNKFASLQPGAKLLGPQIWGCKMKSYEDDRSNGYIPGGKYANGLDCSGFVTWTMINGGFDVGDRGAGENAGSDYDMTDLGKFRRLTYDMIERDEIKVGDLLNFWGHIAIIVGKDADNYYVAESLNTFKAVVVNKYPKNKVMKTFKYVVFMQTVYKEDGNLTDMWY